MNKRTHQILAVLAAFVVSLSVSAETIKLKFQEVAELGAALRALDGTEREVKTADQGVRIIRVPFDLKPVARVTIARNLVAVRAVLDAFEQQRQVLLQRASPGAIEKVASDPVLLAKFSSLWAELVKEPVSIDVVMLTDDQLNLDANKEISGTIIAGLAPLLAPTKK